MSCLENDKLYEAAQERAEAEGVNLQALSELDWEYIYEYLQTGELPEEYEKICYLLYKV